MLPAWPSGGALPNDLLSPEMLVVPAGWMHSAVALDTSFAVSLRLFTPCEEFSFFAEHFLDWLHNMGW